MKITVIVSAMLLLSACSDDPKESNEANFKQALQTQFGGNRECFRVNAIFPLEIVSASSLYKSKANLLEELVESGLLTSEEASVEAKTLLTGKGTGTMKPGFIFSLTNIGEEAVVISKGNFLTGKQSNFCYGSYEVTQVDSFTEPADHKGRVISNVRFSYQAGDVENWAKDSNALTSRFPKLEKFIASAETPLKGDAVLILTNNGWVAEKKLSLR